MGNVHTQKKLSVSLIGCGRVSVKHIRAIMKLSDRFQLCALVDADTNAPQRLLSECGITHAKMDKLFPDLHIYSNYEDMLIHEKPDIVSITVPSGLHYEMARAAIRAGSHLLLEKPMTMKSSEAQDLLKQSESAGIQIAMGHIYRYFPLIGLIHDDIRKGVFGKISHGTVSVRWGHNQNYYDQASWRGTWKNDGGAIMNQTIHALDLICWLMNSQPISAVGHLARRFRNIESEDVGLAILSLQNGTLCQVEGTTATSPKSHEASFFINGDKGSIHLGIRRGIPFFHIRNEKNRNLFFHYLIREIRSKGISSLLSATNPHMAIYEDLHDAIIHFRSPISDAKSGQLSVDTALAIYRSALEKHPVHIPLNTDFSTDEMTGFFGYSN